MKKTTLWIILVIILIISGVFVSLNNSLFTGQIIEGPNFHSSTIAICNQTNYCEDYKVECEGNNSRSITATGFAIQHNEEWKDPRGEQKDNLCE